MVRVQEPAPQVKLVSTREKVAYGVATGQCGSSGIDLKQLGVVRLACKLG